MSDVDPTINGVGGEGFAVDGTDSFAVDPELPPDEPGSRASRQAVVASSSPSPRGWCCCWSW